MGVAGPGEGDTVGQIAITPLEEDIKITERALTAYTDEYREASDIWKTLEGKAQVVITVAGIFLAAVFSFGVAAGIDLRVKMVLGVTLAALLAALLCALWVLKATTYDVPFDSEATMKKVRELLDPSYHRGESGSRYIELIGQLSGGFADSLRSIYEVNTKKESTLRLAYGLLVLAAISATGAAVAQLIIHKA
jgi:hypothetical protein